MGFFDDIRNDLREIRREFVDLVKYSFWATVDSWDRFWQWLNTPGGGVAGISRSSREKAHILDEQLGTSVKGAVAKGIIEELAALDESAVKAALKDRDDARRMAAELPPARLMETLVDKSYRQQLARSFEITLAQILVRAPREDVRSLLDQAAGLSSEAVVKGVIAASRGVAEYSAYHAGDARRHADADVRHYLSTTHAESLREGLSELPEESPVRLWVERLLDISHGPQREVQSDG